MGQYFYLFAIIFLGSFVQGVSGFGIILVSLPLLALKYDVRFLVPLVSLCALTLNALISIQLRKSIQLKTVLSMLLASLVGLPFGVYALKHFSANILLFALGAIVLIYVGFLKFMDGKTMHLHPVWAYIAGLSGGICGGSVGANGPPVIMYLYAQPWKADRIRGTMVSYFLFAGLANSISHFMGGLITRDVVLALSAGLPATILGKVCSGFVSHRLKEQQIRFFVRILICFLGITLIAKSLLSHAS